MYLIPVLYSSPLFVIIGFSSPLSLAAVASKFFIYATPADSVLPEPSSPEPPLPPEHAVSVTVASSLVALHTYFPSNFPEPVNDTYAFPFVNVISQSL